MNSLVPHPSGTIKTKVVGVMFGPTAKNGVNIRQIYLQKIQKLGDTKLRLMAEDSNPFDRDAIMVQAQLDSGWVQLGYISNSEVVCSACDKAWDKVPKKDRTCPDCGDLLEGNGLATRLRNAMRDGITYNVKLLGVTGGDGMDPESGKPKNLGCNIQIVRA